jgi:hypothetical protein
MKNTLKTVLLTLMTACSVMIPPPIIAQDTNTIEIEVDDYERLEELYRQHDFLRNDEELRNLQEVFESVSPWIPKDIEFQGTFPADNPWNLDVWNGQQNIPESVPVPDSGSYTLPENIFDTLILDEGIPPKDLKRALDEYNKLRGDGLAEVDPQTLLENLPPSTRQFFEVFPDQQLIPLFSGLKQELEGRLQKLTEPSGGGALLGSFDSLANNLLQGLGEIALTRAERQGFMLVKESLITLLSRFQFNGPVFSHTIEYLKTNTLVGAFNTHEILKIQLIRDASRLISDVLTFGIFNHVLLHLPSVNQSVNELSQAIATYLEVFLLSDITPERIFSRSHHEVLLGQLHAGFAKIMKQINAQPQGIDEEFTYMLALLADQFYVVLNEKDYLSLAVQEVARGATEATGFYETYRNIKTRLEGRLTTLAGLQPILKAKFDQIQVDLRRVFNSETKVENQEEHILRLVFDITSVIPMIQSIQRDVPVNDSITQLSIRGRRYLSNYPQFMSFFESGISYLKKGNFSLAVYTLTDFVLKNLDVMSVLFSNLDQNIAAIKKNSAAIRKGSALLSTISIYLETYDPENEKYQGKESGELAKIRQESLDTLIDAVTDRTARTGEYILSVGGNVGVFAGLQNVVNRSLDADSRSAGAWLPMGLALQWMPEAKPGVGFHSMLYFFDLGQYVFVREAALSLTEVSWQNAFTLGGQLGLVIAPWGPSALISVGPYFQYTPLISDNQGNAFYNFGLGIGLYIPFFDLN